MTRSCAERRERSGSASAKVKTWAQLIFARGPARSMVARGRVEAATELTGIGGAAAAGLAQAKRGDGRPKVGLVAKPAASKGVIKGIICPRLFNERWRARLFARISWDLLISMC